MHNPPGPLAAAVYVANMASAASILGPIPAHESVRLEAGVCGLSRSYVGFVNGGKEGAGSIDPLASILGLREFLSINFMKLRIALFSSH